jgi:outer membrane receptor protein involved in Fe transport
VLDSGVFTAFGTQLGDYVAALSTLPAAGFAAGEGAIDTYHQVEQGEAIYTQETFTLTRHILITGGLRYTWEDKSLDSHYTNNDTTNLCATLLQIVTKSPTPVPYSEYGYFSKANFGIPCLINPAFKALGSTHQTLSEHALTGAAKIQYRFDSDNMAYAAYSRGNLVGGFNLAEVTQPYGAGGAPNTSLAPQTNTAFPAESVDAFEIGAKNALLHRHLTVDSALFYQTYYDHQLNAFTGTQFVEFTIPRAIAEGVETEIDWAAARGLVFNTGVTYADTYYPNSAINQAALEAPGSNLYLLPGKRLTYAPLWSVTAGGRYEHPIGGTLLLTATTDAKFTSSYSVGSDEDPLKNQKSYVLVDASLTLATVDKRYSVQLWATNLFNQTYKQTAFDGVIQTNSSPPAANPGLNNYYEFPGQPRFFGATIRVKY